MIQAAFLKPIIWKFYEYKYCTKCITDNLQIGYTYTPLDWYVYVEFTNFALMPCYQHYANTIQSIYLILPALLLHILSKNHRVQGQNVSLLVLRWGYECINIFAHLMEIIYLSQYPKW